MATLKDFNHIVALGFDDSSIPARAKSDGSRPIAVRCSQCQALVINGIPAHEQGCINAVAECHGCNELVPANQRYCQDCA